MRVAIVENTAVTHHGQVGVALHEAGAPDRGLYKPWRDGAPARPGGYDALVVFGGEQNALDDATHPYLPRLARLMQDTAAMRAPRSWGSALARKCLPAVLGADNHLGTAPRIRLARGAPDRRRPRRPGPVASARTISHLRNGTPTPSPCRPVPCIWPGPPRPPCRPTASAAPATGCSSISRPAAPSSPTGRAASPRRSRPIARLGRPAPPNMPPRDGVAADAHGLAIARAWVALI